MQPLVPNLHGIYTMQKKISANRLMQTHVGKVVASHNLYMYKDIRCVLKRANKVFAPYSPGCARVSKSTNTFLLRTIYIYIFASRPAQRIYMWDWCLVFTYCISSTYTSTMSVIFVTDLLNLSNIVYSSRDERIIPTRDNARICTDIFPILLETLVLRQNIHQY